MFVCPGAREEPIAEAVFPYGSGCSEMLACPARDFCVWYAAHDLGGSDVFSEFPAERRMAAGFTASPFFCGRLVIDDDLLHRRPKRHAWCSAAGAGS